METPEQIEARVRTALDELGINDWEWIEIDPQFGDTADFCEHYGYDLPHSANTIMSRANEGPAAHARHSAGVRPARREQRVRD